MSSILTSVVLYGNIEVISKENDFKWNDWYSDAKSYIEANEFVYNYFAMTTEEKIMPKVLTVKRSEKKIKEAIDEDNIKSISMYSLPTGFSSAIFDNDLLLIRDVENTGYILLTVNKLDFNDKLYDEFINMSKKYVTQIKGEIFELHKSEIPLFYVNKSNPISSFKSLKVIRKINE